jgi:hypothetical protein
MPRLKRIFIVLALIVASICVGYWLQREVPNENNRVRHPRGYSVCHPDNWSVEVEYSQSSEKIYKTVLLDSLTMTPDHFNGNAPKLFVNRFSGEPDATELQADGWIPGTFQNQPAFVREKELAHAFTKGAFFERAGQWFEVTEGTTVAVSIQKEKWWRFLESFRYPDGQTTGAATARIAPSSAPSSTAPFSFPTVGSQ